MKKRRLLIVSLITLMLAGGLFFISCGNCGGVCKDGTRDSSCNADGAYKCMGDELEKCKC